MNSPSYHDVRRLRGARRHYLCEFHATLSRRHMKSAVPSTRRLRPGALSWQNWRDFPHSACCNRCEPPPLPPRLRRLLAARRPSPAGNAAFPTAASSKLLEGVAGKGPLTPCPRQYQANKATTRTVAVARRMCPAISASIAPKRCAASGRSLLLRWPLASRPPAIAPRSNCRYQHARRLTPTARLSTATVGTRFRS